MRSIEDITALFGEDVVFHCDVGGDPRPEITWKKQDGTLPSSRSQIMDDKALRIMHVRPIDEGVSPNSTNPD